MRDFSKKEAIRTLEQFGYTYLGFLDAGWGEKFYTFKSEDGSCRWQWRLGEMRRRAYLEDMRHWMELQREDEKAAI